MTTVSPFARSSVFDEPRIGGREQLCRTWSGTPLLLLSSGVTKHHTIAISVRLGAPKFVLAELIQVLLACRSVVGIIHAHVCTRLAAYSALFEILAVAAFQNVYFGVVDPRVAMVI